MLGDVFMTVMAVEMALGFALIAFLATVCWANALRAGAPGRDAP